MTESIENELTPEEKLLKVIRDGDDTSASETIAVETTEIAEEKKPELKLVEKDKENKVDVEAVASAVTVTPDVTVATADDNSDPAMVMKSERSSLVSIGFINKIMAIIVIVMIGLTVYEIWMNIKRSRYKTDNTENVLVASLIDQDPEDELPSLGEVLNKFADSEFIGVPEKIEAPGTKPAKPAPTPIEDYVKKNLNLIGLSGEEAIVSDGKTGGMHFLKLGDTMRINDVDVKVNGISSEYVELSDGDKKIRIE